MWYRFGSLDETPGKTGLAHALEHMMFRGSEHISAGGLDDITARLGAQMNGETDYDYTQFYFDMPADKLDVALSIEADRMQHAALRQSDWAIERNAVLNELDDDASSPFFDLLSRVRAAAYPGQPNGRMPLGHRERRRTRDRCRHCPLLSRMVCAEQRDAGRRGRRRAQRRFSQRRSDYFGAIPSRADSAASLQRIRVPASGAVVEADFPFPFEILDLAYAVPGDTEPGEPAISTLATLIENSARRSIKRSSTRNIALTVEAESDTQLQGGLLDVFIVLNPGHTAEEAQAAFQATMQNVLANGFDPNLVERQSAMTIAERLFSADSIRRHRRSRRLHVRHRRRAHQRRGRAPRRTDAAVAPRCRTPLLAPADRRRTLAPERVAPARRLEEERTRRSATISPSAFRMARSSSPPRFAPNVRTPTVAHSTLSPTTFTLPNGLRVIVQEKTDRPTVTILGHIASSPAFEPPGEEGMSRLASDLADYGSMNASVRHAASSNRRHGCRDRVRPGFFGERPRSRFRSDRRDRCRWRGEPYVSGAVVLARSRPDRQQLDGRRRASPARRSIASTTSICLRRTIPHCAGLMPTRSYRSRVRICSPTSDATGGRI